jgi:predicted methyltransferase
MVRTVSWMRSAALAAVAMGACVAVAAPKLDFAAILADPSRPDADKARDADRKPAEVVEFAHVRPGDKIAELAPGGGYFTNILSAVVGPKGKIYAIVGRPSDTLQALANARPNVAITPAQPGTIPVPEPLDMVWTTLNYHDFKNRKIGDSDAAVAYNAAAFNSLKRGGIYFIVDHEAGQGKGASVTSTLHRIESETVKREVEKAGFRLEAHSDILRHPADDHSQRVIEAGIRGKTDQFVFRFRKPLR